MIRAYYNDNDSYVCQWLRSLIAAGHITPGDVDERSIADVQPSDLAGYDRVHFFAGIAGWDHALNLAGWGDHPVWTGSCPCQPFSAAGKRKGTADERHLWPEFLRLIRECRPPVIFGEQVASTEVVGSQLEADFLVAVQRGSFARANKLAKRLVASPSFTWTKRWVDGIQSDLAGENYAFRFAVLGAHSKGAPHIRQRLFWVAFAEGSGGWTDAGAVRGGETARLRTPQGKDQRRASERSGGVVDSGATRGLALSNGGQSSDGNLQRGGPHGQQPQDGGAGGLGQSASIGDRTPAERGSDCTGQGERRIGEPGGSGATDRLGDPRQSRLAGREGERGHDAAQLATPERAGGDAGFWSDFDLIPCRDEKARRVESGSFPLVDGLPFRLADGRTREGVSRAAALRGIGNAIVPQTAAAFVRACMESL